MRRGSAIDFRTVNALYQQHYNSPRCQKAAAKLLHAATSDAQGVYFLPEERGGEMVMLRYKRCIICQKHIGLGLGTKFAAYEMHLKSAQCNLPSGSRIAVSIDGKLSIFLKDGSQLSYPYTNAMAMGQGDASRTVLLQTRNGDEVEVVGTTCTVPEEVRPPQWELKRKVDVDADREGYSPSQKRTRLEPEVRCTTSPYFKK